MTILPQGHVFQRNSTECGWCVVSMVHAIRHKPKSVDDILRTVGLRAEPYTCFAGQLASYFLKNGFGARLLVSTAKIVIPNWAGLPNRELSENLNEWISHHPTSPLLLDAQHMASFVKEGGKLEFGRLTSELMREKLEAGSLLIPFLDESWIWGHRFLKGKLNDLQGQSDGHCVLLTEWRNGEIEVWDPYSTNLPSRHGCYQVASEDIVNATLTWDAMVVEVLKQG